jgi:hypothetical protein
MMRIILKERKNGRVIVDEGFVDKINIVLD